MATNIELQQDDTTDTAEGQIQPSLGISVAQVAFYIFLVIALATGSHFASAFKSNFWKFCETNVHPLILANIVLIVIPLFHPEMQNTTAYMLGQVAVFAIQVVVVGLFCMYENLKWCLSEAY